MCYLLIELLSAQRRLSVCSCPLKCLPQEQLWNTNQRAAALRRAGAAPHHLHHPPTPPTTTSSSSSVQKQSLALTAVCVLYTFSGKLDQNQRNTNNWVLALEFKYLPIICPFAPLHKRSNPPAAPLPSKTPGSAPPKSRV